MSTPTFPKIAEFLAGLVAGVLGAANQYKAIADKALADAKAAVDAVAPGAADDIIAQAQAKLDAAKAAADAEILKAQAEADPAALAQTAVAELLDALKTGQSPVRHPPTTLAG